jgi:hypothetical protein
VASCGPAYRRIGRYGIERFGHVKAPGPVLDRRTRRYLGRAEGGDGCCLQALGRAAGTINVPGGFFLT